MRLKPINFKLCVHFTAGFKLQQTKVMLNLDVLDVQLRVAIFLRARKLPPPASRISKFIVATVEKGTIHESLST